MWSAARVTNALLESVAAYSAVVRRRCASAYRAGETIDDAIRACRLLAVHGVASTVGYAAASGEAPRAVADAHLDAFRMLETETLDCYVSVKLSALGLEGQLGEELVDASARAGRRLHFDAVAPDAVDVAWRLLEAGADRAPDHAPLGTTLPGRWRRSVDDAARASELGLAVRVVKGQWADRNGGVDPSRGFLAVVDRLCGHPGVVAVATHDVSLLTESLHRLLRAGTRCELELFTGLPFRAAAAIAARAGVPTRVYVPYGHAGAPYRGVDLAAHPTRARWFVEDLLLGPDKTWRSVRQLGRV
jgi:proline dehydrogenase